MNQNRSYSSKLEINLSAIRHNCKVCIETAGVPVMAVIKANAYGFGAIPVARACVEAGISSFAVARLAEGLELREAGFAQDILIFALMNTEEFEQAVAAGLTVSLNQIEQIETLENLALRIGYAPKIHLKIDTGMSRFGFLPEELPEVIERIRKARAIQIEGVYSHYANIDDDPEDALNTLQKKRFDSALSLLKNAGIRPRWIHFTNSAAVFNSPESHYTLIRIGNGLLGVNPFYYQDFPPYLEKALTWTTQLISVRKIPAGAGVGYAQHETLATDSWIGVVPVGYGDGYRRVPGNEVLIRGKRVPVIGSVCTDVMMVKLPEKMEAGEEVVLIGRQGDESIDIEMLADRWLTARADVTSGISERVTRTYVN